MLHPTKSLFFAAVVVAAAAMMTPAHVEARGGGGGGGGRGGGGGGGGRGFGGGMGGGMGSGSFSRGSSGFSGGSGYRGFSGTSGAAVRSYTPANPGSGAWRNGGYGRWGNRGWGWGWGIGAGYWGFGGPFWYGGWPFWYTTLPYGAYVNPYYVNGYDYGGYDYGAPIQPSQSDVPPQDNDSYSQARAAFYAGNYQEALQNINQAAMAMPGDEDVHQFHALVFFAMGNYQPAAAVAHTVLDSGRGWNWSVLQSFYPSPDVYTNQLRALEHNVSDNPNQAATRFLLGYEYLMLGHYKAANRQFTKVVALEPRDTLAKNILAGLGSSAVGKDEVPSTAGPTGSSGSTGQPSNATPLPPNGPTNGPTNGGPSLPPVPPAPPSTPSTTPSAPSGPAPTITGSWKASPAPGVSIEATLQPDKHFTWKFTENGQNAQFTGTYEQQGNELILTRDQDGQKMDGTVTVNPNGGFGFRLKNTDPNDVGLQFTK
jgi:hypothetical protein